MGNIINEQTVETAVETVEAVANVGKKKEIVIGGVIVVLACTGAVLGGRALKKKISSIRQAKAQETDPADVEDVEETEEK